MSARQEDRNKWTHKNTGVNLTEFAYCATTFRSVLDKSDYRNSTCTHLINTGANLSIESIPDRGITVTAGVHGQLDRRCSSTIHEAMESIRH